MGSKMNREYVTQEKSIHYGIQKSEGHAPLKDVGWDESKITNSVLKKMSIVYVWYRMGSSDHVTVI